MITGVESFDMLSVKKLWQCKLSASEMPDGRFAMGTVANKLNKY